jgi:uncharacterized repeat protein (TIGR02543 family)/uncharacterized repeat protein (TIGR01451 family)
MKGILLISKGMYFIRRACVSVCLMMIGSAGVYGAYSSVTDGIWGSAHKWSTVVTQWGGGGDSDLKVALEAVTAYDATTNPYPYIILVGSDIVMSEIYNFTDKNVVLRKITGGVEKPWNYNNAWINPSASSPDLYDNESDFNLQINPTTTTPYYNFEVSGRNNKLILENVSIQGRIPPTADLWETKGPKGQGYMSKEHGGAGIDIAANSCLTFAGVIRDRAQMDTTQSSVALMKEGAIHLNGYSKLNIIGGIYAHNQSHCAAVILDRSLSDTINISGYSIFENNYSDAEGGVIIVVSSSQHSRVNIIGNVIFRKNISLAGGGAIDMHSKGTINIGEAGNSNTNIIFSENKAVYAFDGTANSYPGNGGAILMAVNSASDTSVLNIYDGVHFVNNLAERGGGAIALANGNRTNIVKPELNLYGGTFTGNEATGKNRNATTDFIGYAIGAGGAIFSYFPKYINIPANSTVTFSDNMAAYSAFIDNGYLLKNDSEKDTFYRGDTYVNHILKADVHTSVVNSHGPTGADYYNLYNNYDIGATNSLSSGLFALVKKVIIPSNGQGGSVTDTYAYLDPLGTGDKYATLRDSIVMKPVPASGWFLKSFEMTNEPALSPTEFARAWTGPFVDVYALKVPDVETTLTAKFNKKATLAGTNITFPNGFANTYYEQPAVKDISIRHTGTSIMANGEELTASATNITAELVDASTPGMAAKFTLTTGGGSIAPAGENTSWKVQPVSSQAAFATPGIYAARVKIKYNDGAGYDSVYVNVSMTLVAQGEASVVGADENGDYDFGDVVIGSAGYVPSKSEKGLEVENIGSLVCDNISISIINQTWRKPDGTDVTGGTYFTITGNAVDALTGGSDTVAYKVNVASGLSPGEYWADLKMTYEPNGGASQTKTYTKALHFKVYSAASLMFEDFALANVDAELDFGEVMVGYAGTYFHYENATLKNSGDVTAGVIKMNVSGDGAGDFMLTGPLGDSTSVIANVQGHDENNTWSVMPKTGLTAGRHTATLTATYVNGAGDTLTTSGRVTLLVTHPPFGASVTETYTTLEVGTVDKFKGNSLAAPAGMSFDWVFEFGDSDECYLADTAGVANGVEVQTAWWKTGVKNVTATIRCKQGVNVLADSVITIPITVTAPSFPGVALNITPALSVASGTLINATVANAGTPENLKVKYFWLADQYKNGVYSSSSDYSLASPQFSDFVSDGVEGVATSAFKWVEPGVKDVWALVRWLGRDSITAYDTILHQQVTVTVIASTDATGKTAVIRGSEQLGTSGTPHPVYYKLDTIKYGIRIHNTSDITKAVTVIDTVPAGLQTPFDITHGGVWNATDRTITWALDSVQGANGGLNGGRDTVWYKATQAAGEAALGTVFANSAKIYYDKGGNVVTTNTTYHKATGVTVSFAVASIPSGVDPGGALGGSASPQLLDYGQTAAAGVSADPYAGYTFAGWMLPKYTAADGASIDTIRNVNDYTTIPIKGNATLTAVFRLDTPALNMSVSATPSGAVYIYDTVKFTASFTPVNGLAAPSYSWRFLSDYSDDCSVAGGLSSAAAPEAFWKKAGTKKIILDLTFAASSDASRTYTVSDTVEVEVKVPEFGTRVAPSPLSAVAGTDFTFTATPNSYPAYTLNYSWTFDGSDNIITGTSTLTPTVRWYDTGVKTAKITMTYYKGAQLICSETVDTTITVTAPVFTGSLVSVNGTTVSGGVYSGLLSTGTAVAFATVGVPSTPANFTASYLWSFPNGATPSSSTSATESATWYDYGTKHTSLKITWTAAGGGVSSYDTTIYADINVQPVVTVSNGGLSASLYGVRNEGSAASPVAVYYTDTIYYYIALENLSALNTAVSFSDTIPAGVTFAGGSAGITGSVGSQIVTWSGNVNLNGGRDTVVIKATPKRGQNGVLLVNPGAVITYDNGGRIVTTNATYHRGADYIIHFAATSGGTLSSGATASQELEYKDALLPGVTPLPFKGYSFEGWSRSAYVSRTGASVPVTSAISSYTSLTADGGFTLTAVFSPIIYPITYTLISGDTTGCNNPLSYTVLTPSRALAAPKRTGYEFKGWRSPAGVASATPIMAPVIPIADSVGALSYEACWEIVRYKITYVQTLADVEATGNPLSYTVDTSAITLSSPVRHGYNFLGWSFVSSDGVTITQGSVIPAGTHGNITATAVWSSPVNYNITVVPNWVTPPAVTNRTSYNITESFSLYAPVAGAPGYDFAGYDVTSDAAGTLTGGGPGPLHSTTTVPAGMFGNLTVTPVWSAHDYKITYVYSADVTSKPNITGYEVTTLPDTVLNRPSRRGYDFAGWVVSNLTAGGTTNVTDSVINIGTTGDLQFSDSWTPIVYNIIYDTLAGYEYTNKQFTTYSINETTAKALPSGARAGYDFIGWEIKDAATNAVISSSAQAIPAKVYGDLKLRPLFTIHTYSINYVLNGGVFDTSLGANPVSYTIETPAFAITQPSRLGYTFTGWTLVSTETGIPAFTSPTVPTGIHGDLTLTAGWTVNNYTITYTDDLNGSFTDGALRNSYTVNDAFTIGASAVAAALPLNAGRVFVGWKGTNVPSYQTSVYVPTGTTGNLSYTSYFSYKFSDNSIPDTVFSESPTSSPVTLLSGGDGVSYMWSLPDGSSSTSPSINASLSGNYILTTNYGSVTVSDTVTVLFAFDALTDLIDVSTEPAKAGYPQKYDMNTNPAVAAYTTVTWSLPSSAISSVAAGVPVAAALSGIDTTSVTFPAVGSYTVSCTVTVTIGSVTYTRTFTLPVFIAAKSRGWFVACEEYLGTRTSEITSQARNDGSDWIASLARNDGATRAARTASGAGTSWEGAFITLDEALAVATKGDFIWVAKGVYSPANGSYNLTNDEVQIYGGFAGNETNLNQRNFALNETVLHGSASGGSVMINQGGSSASRWDGFIIEGGKAVSGGGILNINASPTIANCVIRNNIATSYGGGIASTGIGSAPVIYNTEISGNKAAYGGGLYFSFSSLPSTDVVSAVLTNVTVAGNYASEEGGGVYSVNTSTSSTAAEIRNSIIYGNRSAAAAVADVGGSSAVLFASSMISGSGGSRAWNTAFGIDGGGNYDGNPFFRRGGFDSDGRMIPGDYYIRATEGYAPYNAGNNAYLTIGRHAVSMPLQTPDALNDAYYSDRLLYDLSGWERRINENCDMGAYEYNPDYPNGVNNGSGIVDDNTGLQHQVIVRTAEGMRSLPGAGIYYMPGHSDMVIKVVAVKGWSIAGLSVVTGSIQMDSKNGATVSVVGDTAYVTLHQIVEDLDVHFNGISRTGADGIPSVDAPTRSKMYFYAGRLYVKPAAPVRVYIFTLTGVLFGEIDFVEEGSVMLPQGIYVVRSSDGVLLKVIKN